MIERDDLGSWINGAPSNQNTPERSWGDQKQDLVL